MNKLKTYFLIINLVFTIFAFNYLITAQDDVSLGREINPSEINLNPPTITPTPNTGGAGININVPNPPSGIETPTNVNINLNSETSKSTGGILTNFFAEGLGKNLISIASMTLLGAGIGSLAGGKNGAKWGAISGASGTIAKILAERFLLKNGATGLFGLNWFTPTLFGIGIGIAIFILTYKKTFTQTVEFNCLPYQPPIGGNDCQLCNDYKECSEYTCKSLGQACELVNKGTKEQKCIWKNPYDVNSPLIKILEVNKGLKFTPDNKIRPPATGIIISQKNGECIEAFTPLEFTFTTKDSDTGIGEPSQCRIDYNLTTGLNAFEEMSYYVGGNSLFDYNHTEKMSLPGPDKLNKIAPELKNDGTYTLYIRCQDANGNFNNDAFSVRFCIKQGPDTTPPKIEDTSISSNSPIQFNQTNLDLEVYVNEPSECKWSREDQSYDNMENNMDCDLNVWEMNSNDVYTCRTMLTGIEDRKENKYYFRCKDQPELIGTNEESNRIENKQSYLYTIMGTQPLNILKVQPMDETIYGSTETIPVFLEIETDNGFNNGESICYYSNILPRDESDYVEFLETGTNLHKQRQDLVTGDYKYYFKCIDLGGNTVYNSTSFSVKTDKQPPNIIRIYKESEKLKIITDEDSDCSYSNKDCNFEIDDGIKMDSLDYKIHNAEWVINKKYYIRCKDKYNNQPNPNTCSLIAKLSKGE